MTNQFDIENPDKKQLKRIYNDPSVYSWSFDQLDGYKDPLDKIRMQIIIDTIQKRTISSILDDGCGGAVISRRLANLGYKVTGFDISKKLLDKIPKTTNLVLTTGTSEKLPFKNNSFDCVICSEVLEHITDNHPVILEISRVVKKDGTVLVTVPNLAGYDSLDGKWKVITRPIGFVNFFLRIFKMPEVYKYGYSTHVHKLFPWQWKKILSSAGLEVTYDRPLFISPWLPDIFKFIDRFIYGIPGILKFKIWYDNLLCNIWPFRYLGQCHLFVCKPSGR
ncbi:Ubiquinone biosynthesis O-methyltransferase [Candidatus Bilamarchaeum dharawalense]|uniref:Ubiquinone biosynthesis O-methyltransferase n=1 Tax=Candidatus Bilamarchaeum dharawalense TaxID=2885759 RepID=A0A5E4LNZ9_9ARCH|nr:Ubiquinone biosynthesis O-methyltransferase [Candidatus Bilamarchaeum dharawalense]